MHFTRPLLHGALPVRLALLATSHLLHVSSSRLSSSCVGVGAPGKIEAGTREENHQETKSLVPLGRRPARQRVIIDHPPLPCWRLVMQTEQQIQNPTPMNEDSAPDLNVENTQQQQQQSVVAAEEHHQHQHQQHPHYVHDGLVDMVALQTIASQSAPLFATSASTGDDSSGGDSHNSPANGHHGGLHHEGVKRSVSPEGLSRTRPAPEDGEDGEGGEERDKKRQRRYATAPPWASPSSKSAVTLRMASHV